MRTKKIGIIVAIFLSYSLYGMSEPDDLIKAIEQNDIQGVQALVQSRVPLDKRYGHRQSTALHRAIENGKEKIAHILVAHDAPLDVKDATGTIPLHDAVENNCSLDLIKHMLGKNSLLVCERTARCSLIELAAHAGRADCIDELKKYGAPCGLGNDDETLLHQTAFKDSEPTARAILAINKEYLEKRDARKRTPLLFAAQLAAPKVIQFLLEQGANKDAQDNEGHDIYYYAQHCTDKVVDWDDEFETRYEETATLVNTIAKK